MNQEISPNDIRSCLSDCNFPASKNDLVSCCRSHNGSQDMINALENVQADNFQNLDSVVNAVETNLGNEDVTTEFFGEEEIDELY